MGKNLFDYSSENIEESDNVPQKEEQSKNSNDEIISEAGKLYDKYKGYSTDELKDEFLSLSKRRLSDGSLSKEKLTSTVSSLSPFLTGTQEDFLDKLIGELDD